MLFRDVFCVLIESSKKFHDMFFRFRLLHLSEG